MSSSLTLPGRTEVTYFRAIFLAELHMLIGSCLCLLRLFSLFVHPRYGIEETERQPWKDIILEDVEMLISCHR